MTEVRFLHTNLRLTHAAHSVEHYVVEGEGLHECPQIGHELV